MGQHMDDPIESRINPYDPTVSTPAAVPPQPTDEVLAFCRLCLGATYFLASSSIAVLPFLEYWPEFVGIVFFLVAAPATMWAFLDSEIHNRRARLSEILLIAIVWPIGLLIYLQRTRKKRGTHIWLKSLIWVSLSSVFLFGILMCVFVAIVLASFKGPG